MVLPPTTSSQLVEKVARSNNRLKSRSLVGRNMWLGCGAQDGECVRLLGHGSEIRQLLGKWICPRCPPPRGECMSRRPNIRASTRSNLRRR